MMNFSLLSEKFPDVIICDTKISVKHSIVEVLSYLKNNSEFDFDMLTSIVAIDLIDSTELIYQLYSSNSHEKLNVSYVADFFAPSVIDIYKSAYFDECEIYDLFGVKFDGNLLLKRLFMPETWVGHPLLKNYKQEDERLAWND